MLLLLIVVGFVYTGMGNHPFIIQHVQSAVKRPVSRYMKYTICLWPLFTIIDARSENLQYLQGKQSKAMMTSLVGESY